MTGIAVGIAAVILMVAIGTATQKQVIDQIQNLGANVMMVVPAERTGRRRRPPQRRRRPTSC